MSPTLAHGLLGDFDEIVFLAVPFIFVAFMAISWIRSRNMEENLEEEKHDFENSGDHSERFELE